MTLHELVGFPRTDLCVSPLGLGTAGFGVELPDLAAHAVLDAYVDMGGNFIDTGRAYSDRVPGERGRAERVVGDWLCRRRSARKHLILATKTRWLGGGDVDAAGFFSTIRAEIDASLRALGVKQLDLYYLNGDIPEIPAGEIVDFIDERRSEGKARYFAAAYWSADRLQQARDHAQRSGRAGFVAHQVLYNIGSWRMPGPVDPEISAMDRALHDFHRREGLGAVACTAQAEGVFSKSIHAHAPLVSVKNGYRYDSPENNRLVASIAGLAGRHGCSPNAIVLAYLLRRPFPVFPLCGCRRVEQLIDAVSALRVRLAPEEARMLEEVSGSAAG